MRTEWGQELRKAGLDAAASRRWEREDCLCPLPASVTRSWLWDKQHWQWSSGHLSDSPQHPAALCSSVLFQHIKLPQCLPNFWGIRLVVLGKLRSLSFVLLCRSVLHLMLHSCSSFLHFPPFRLTSNFSDVYLLFFLPYFSAFHFSIHHGARPVSLLEVVLPLLSQNIFIQSKDMTTSPFCPIRWFFKLEIHFFSLSFLSQCPHESRNITEPILRLGKPGHQEISFFQQQPQVTKDSVAIAKPNP